MTSIIKATKKDSGLLTEIGKKSFLESHGHSADPSVINSYINKTYTDKIFEEELANSKNIYHIIYHDQLPAGYSKIMLDTPHPDVPAKNVTKLERIYLLKKFYGSGLGPELFNLVHELSKNSNQAGMWLFVWKENNRAVSFYKKTGFRIIGSYDFKLTETHSNPNHLMFLEY